MKKYVFIWVGLLSFLNAVPNYWYDGFAQGWSIYQINSNNQVKVYISCNTGFDFETDHNVIIYDNGKELKDNIEFVINGKVYFIPTLPTSTRGGGIEWDKTMSALSKATKFELYVNNKYMDTFTPSNENLNSVFPGMNSICESQFSKPLE